MTRILTDGAEMADTLFWDLTSNCTAVSATPTPYESAYCYKITTTGGYGYKNITAISECYVRARVLISHLGDPNTSYFPAFLSSSTALAWLSIDNAYHPTINTSGGVLETDGGTLNLDQWYLFEIYFKLDDNPNGRFVVYQDGIQIIDFTGDTKPGAQTTFDRIEWRRCVSSTPGNSGWYIAVDDIAVNDTNGGADNSYCGDGVIIKVTPDGNGAHNNWHGSDADDVNNYLLVDEFPSDGDTTFVYHDGAASGTQDQYALSDYDGTDRTILRIYPEARIRKTSAASHTVKLGTLASGGTDAMSSGKNLTTSYARVVGNEQTVNPVDSGAWEEADIDALQFVVEVG